MEAVINGHFHFKVSACLLYQTNLYKKIEELNRKPTYWGDWSYENFYPFFDIELLQITPYYYKYQGKLIDDREIDETEDMITLLEKCRIFYEQKQKIIIIYGYKKNH